jgi:two-component system, OmpR family, phosphate regulon response regulator OmpR
VVTPELTQAYLKVTYFRTGCRLPNGCHKVLQCRLFVAVCHKKSGTPPTVGRFRLLVWSLEGFFAQTSMQEPKHLSTRVLLVDDEPELRALLQRYLGEQGLTVRAVPNAAEMDRLLAREVFDVMVLDLMLPGEDGLSICRRLRAQGETMPIIMLTARGEPVDRILGLEMGADDYLPKPFSPRELLARVSATLRRQDMALAGAAAPKEDLVHFGPFVLNLSALTLMRGNEPIALTSTEFVLLKVLLANRGRPMGRDRLLELSQGRDTDTLSRSVDVQVLRLRRLIEDDPANPVWIKTIWGKGYVFVEEASE